MKTRARNIISKKVVHQSLPSSEMVIETKTSLSLHDNDQKKDKDNNVELNELDLGKKILTSPILYYFLSNNF